MNDKTLSSLSHFLTSHTNKLPWYKNLLFCLSIIGVMLNHLSVPKAPVIRKNTGSNYIFCKREIPSVQLAKKVSWHIGKRFIHLKSLTFLLERKIHWAAFNPELSQKKKHHFNSIAVGYLSGSLFCDIKSRNMSFKRRFENRSILL